MVTDYAASLQSFAASNADAVTPVESAIAHVRTAMEALGEAHAFTPPAMSKLEAGARNAYIQAALAACVNSMQALQGAVLSGALTHMEARHQLRKQLTLKAARIATVKD